MDSKAAIIAAGFGGCWVQSRLELAAADVAAAGFQLHWAAVIAGVSSSKFNLRRAVGFNPRWLGGIPRFFVGVGGKMWTGGGLMPLRPWIGDWPRPRPLVPKPLTTLLPSPRPRCIVALVSYRPYAGEKKVSLGKDPR